MPESESSIPVPNLRNPQEFDQWLREYITTPLVGLEDKTHPDGKHYSPEEQLEETFTQIKDVVEFTHTQKKPPEQILQMLMNIARRQEPKL